MPSAADATGGSPPSFSGGSAPACGSSRGDCNAYIASGVDPALVAGTTVWLQFWFRDTAGYHPRAAATACCKRCYAWNVRFPRAEQLEDVVPGSSGPAEASAEVLARLARGDVAALEELFATYGERVFRVCQGILGNRADAEDATQEVFLRAFEQASSFSGKSRYSSWLLKLTVNHTLNLAKVVRRHRGATLSSVAAETIPGTDSPMRDAMGREQTFLLARLLMELPIDRRQVLVLRELAGLGYADIAEVLQVPVGTVTSRLIRGRRQLRTLLRERAPNLLESG